MARESREHRITREVYKKDSAAHTMDRGGMTRWRKATAE
jgi:hypothetical protein